MPKKVKHETLTSSRDASGSSSGKAYIFAV